MLRHVRDNGRQKHDRTGTGTRAVFGHQIRFDLAEGFPLLTTKKVFTRGIIAELLWMLSGDTCEKTLSDQNVNIWKEWADPETGELGRVYGAQWRSWFAVKNPVLRAGRSVGKSTATHSPFTGEVVVVDQMANLINDLKTNPTSRRMIVTGWNPGELDQMALPPCHMMMQFYCEELTDRERAKLYVGQCEHAEQELMTLQHQGLEDLKDYMSKVLDNMDEHNVPKYRLSCQLYQRSADIFLGVPFNIASYALLTQMIAQCVNMVPGDFVHTFGDLHIYNNHFDQVDEQLSREPRPLPTMKINPDVKDLFSFKVEDFTLEGYDPCPAIKAEVSV